MIKVDIDIDTAENIFGVVLKQQYGRLSPTCGRVPMFSIDKEENELQYKELKNAFELVAEHTGVDLYGK